MSFPKQAALATVVIGGVVGGLYLFGPGRSKEAPQSETPSEGASSVPAAPKDPEGDKAEAPLLVGGPLSEGQKARELVPPGAWLVADFQGDLTGQKPFAGEPGLCASVPAPKRVVVAVLPPKVDKEPDLLIAARDVEDTFWGCARDMVVRAGGTALAQNDQYEVLKSPSGVVARGPAGSLTFISSEAHLEEALSTLSELKPGAGRSGEHAKLYARMHKSGRPVKDSVLDLTMVLPPDFLSTVGEDKDKTPLRFIESAFLTNHTDGSAQGGIDCEEAGCDDVLKFLQRARGDLLQTLPEPTRKTIDEALHLRHEKGAGRISVEWDPSRVSLGTLLGQFLGAPLGR